MNDEYITLETEAEEDAALELVTEESEQSISLEVEQEGVGDYPNYTGAYTVTPTDEAQTLPSAFRVLTENITVEPIPSNYGKITWDGGTLIIT